MGCVDWPGNHVRIEGRGAISAEEMIKVIEGLALRKPRRSVATIQRQASAVDASARVGGTELSAGE